MKKLLILLCTFTFSLFPYLCEAQYQYTDLHNFRTSHGASPYGSLTRGGYVLYGMTSRGGAHGYGCIYSLDTNGNNFKDLVDLNNAASPKGYFPLGALLLSGGKLFGMTYEGGAHGEGCLFSVDTVGTNYKDLVDFNGNTSPNGANPFGTLIISGTTLYGMAYSGGTGYGCIFSIDSSGSGYTDLHNFTGTTGGEYPYGSLVISGNELFGMTASGGTNSDGLVFSLHTDGSAYNVLLNLSVLGGETPLGSIILTGKMLYGMTYQGGAIDGEIFRVDTNGHEYKDLHNFTGGLGGYPMYTQLSILGGTLYGMTGDYANTGQIFSMDTSGSAFAIIYSFNNPTGSNPFGALMLSGNRMYGMTYEGGTADSGVVFSFRTCSLNASMTINSNVSCCRDSNGSATATASAGVSPYTYSWSTHPAQTNAMATGLKAGTYTVSVYDSTGCYTSLTVTITQPPCLQDSILGSPSLGCNCHGTIEVFPYGGTPPYTYLWNNGDTYDTVHNLSAGCYSVTVCDNHGCCIKDSFCVPAGDPVYPVVINDKCYGDCNGSISITVWGWNGFLWSPGGQTTASISGLCAGSYSVLITNLDTACTATYSFSITQPPPFTATVSLNHNVLCNGQNDGNASVSASGGAPPYTYSWSDGETTATASTLPAGLATVIVTDANGCTASGSVTITQPAAPLAVTCTTYQGNCSTQANFLATATGGTPPYIYTWPSGIYGSGNTATVSTFCPMFAYSPFGLTVTDANGCTAFCNGYFNTPIQFYSVQITNVTCYGGNNGSVSVVVCSSFPGNFLYTVSPGGSNYSYNQPYVYTNLTAGNYTITATDQNGCTTYPYPLTITQPAQIVVTTTVAAASCTMGGTATASVTSGGIAPYTYFWSGGAGTNATASNLSAGIYTVTVTDNNGCSSTAAATITGTSSLNIITTDLSNITCRGGNNGAASATVSGGASPYTYSWSNGNTTTSVSGLTAGTYTLSVTDANNCLGLATVLITQPNQLSVTASQVAAIACNGGNGGSASSTVSGGTSPYTYSWSVGGSNSTVSNLSAGTFTITVHDNCGASATAAVTITQPAAFYINLVAFANVACYGGNTGNIGSGIGGGTSPYTFSWSPPEGTNQWASNLTAGTYTLHVTDNNGCTGSASITITQPNQLSVSATTITNLLCNGGNIGSASSTVSGGTKPFTYFWSNTASTASISNLSAGTYTVTVHDSCGASATATTLITEPTALNVSAITTSNVGCYGVNNGGASCTVSGGTKPFTYFWSNTASTASISNLSAGTYTVTVHDSCGASATAAAAITQPAALTIISDSINDNGTCSGAAWVLVSGGTNPYTYLWTGGNTTDSIYSQCYGNYCCTITDAHGCIDSACVTINLTTGVSQVKGESGKVTVYPNPNNGVFTITNYELGITNIEIYNVLGQQVYSQFTIHNSPFTIDLSDKSAGVYFYRVINEDGSLIGEGKIVIEK